MRQLERTIGSICRAVAVKVAEKTPPTQTEAMQTETKELGGAVDNHLQEGVEDVHGGVDGDVSTEVANSIEDTALEVLALPPELPIVIDEQALEDILGVCSLEQQPNTTTVCLDPSL